MDPLLNLKPFQPLSPLGETPQAAAQSAQSAKGGGDFADLLKEAMQEVNDAQAQAEVEARKLMTGGGADMHSAILAVQKADVSFQMMMAVRSKLIDAYREVMRMQM